MKCYGSASETNKLVKIDNINRQGFYLQELFLIIQHCAFLIIMPVFIRVVIAEAQVDGNLGCICMLSASNTTKPVKIDNIISPEANRFCGVVNVKMQLEIPPICSTRIVSAGLLM